MSESYGPTIDVTVAGLDAAGQTVAQAELKAVRLRAGATAQEEIFLNCFGKCSATLNDAGVTGDGATLPPEATNCGNGKLDPGEICDPAISAPRPGSCTPNECNDGLACTRDFKMGSACNVQCVHQEILTVLPGDGCCPADGTHDTDEDCSATCGNGVVDSQEACDKALPADTPGACPTASLCNDGNACTVDQLISANTCAARCTHQAITASNVADGCCPANATAATDSDCPVVCGNGLVETGETCDTAIGVGKTGACPTTCNDDQACTTDAIVGAGCKKSCVHGEVNVSSKSDGCCPANASAAADPDCAATCGNGVVEASETCDKGIAVDQPGACPKNCPPIGCHSLFLRGSEEACTASCEIADSAACLASVTDRCCSPGCTPASDGDCPSACGDGLVESNETCDKALVAPASGACPTTCDDADPCTEDLWESKGSCLDQCVHRPVTAFKSGDLCCPAGANRSVDVDCAAVCGNGLVEAEETCDRSIAAGKPGSCPSACVPASACSTAKLVGSTPNCTAQCLTMPISICASGDGCCPATCSANEDSDCPVVCGNGQVEQGEACDKGITAGFAGACESECGDLESCNSAILTGSVENCSRRCSIFLNRACAGGDGCCPVGCSFRNDLDCAPICGNGVVEDGEACDPPANCPTSCQADTDPCTVATLLGNPATCTARCRQTPVMECGSVTDQCCPSGCAFSGDPDCKPDNALVPPNKGQVF